jgi:hypothetical protein
VNLRLRQVLFGISLSVVFTACTARSQTVDDFTAQITAELKARDVIAGNLFQEANEARDRDDWLSRRATLSESLGAPSRTSFMRQRRLSHVLERTEALPGGSGYGARRI